MSKKEKKDAEKEALIDFFKNLDKKTLKVSAEAISMFVRAFEGKPIEPDDIITRLTNVKELLERSRFPTYPLLAKQVYLRLIATYNPQAYACREWADLEGKALISYKGLSREEYVEMTKATTGITEPQQFFLGERKAEIPRKRFLSRFRRPKAEEESEFIAT